MRKLCYAELVGGQSAQTFWQIILVAGSSRRTIKKSEAFKC